MRTISLFSGCGGMDLGAERVGAEVVFANDILQAAADTYERYFPHVPFVRKDVGEVGSFPKADLLIGGYPCQSFSLGGNRSPEEDERTHLYLQFARCLESVNPSFFVAENVKGLKSVAGGRWLREQLLVFESVGRHGYNLSWALVDASQYGVPQRRKRVFIVGVRKDLRRFYWFPQPTHDRPDRALGSSLKPHAAHGEAITGLPLWPKGEFYERPHDPEGHFAWYYMSRNRKAPWDGPSYTIVANFRHAPLHPASPVMKLTWSDLANGWKQRWDFSDEYEHTEGHPERPILEEPRRLSWRECALIQTFPWDFEPAGDLERKIEQIGNAVPPLLTESLIGPLITGEALQPDPPPEGRIPKAKDYRQLAITQVATGN